MNPQPVDLDSWTDSVPHCHETGIGDMGSAKYNMDGSKTDTNLVKHDFKEYCCFQNKLALYGIFTGHNGNKIAKYALQCMSANLAFKDHGNKEDVIKSMLKHAFIHVEKEYHQNINFELVRRSALITSIPDGLSEYEISLNYKHVLDELNEINESLSVGASVVLAIIYNSKLYIGNIGVCRALLCKSDSNNVLRVTQLTVDHDLNNPDEADRFRRLGLDVEVLKQHDSFFPTRCIGNYMGKVGYKDSTYLSSAKSAPVLAVADFEGPIELDKSCRFLMLMSKGLCKSLVDIFQSESSLVNKEIVQSAVQSFRTQSSLMSIAQAVVNNVSLLHYDKFIRTRDEKISNREDMTLLLRNFNYSIPNYATEEGESTSDEGSTNNSDFFGVDAPLNVDPYVDFSEYNRLLEEAKWNGTLPKGIDFN